MDTFHVAPVHLVADWDVLRLFQFEPGELSESLQQQVMEQLSPLFSEEGMQLEYMSDLRWRLRSPQKEQIQTTPLEWATGSNLSDAMPSGEGALRWKQLLNEAQMLLHAEPPQQQPDQLAINGIWIWRDPSLLDRLRHRWSQRRSGR